MDGELQGLFDPETRAPMMLKVNIVFMGVTVLVVGLRFYTKISTKITGLDDVLIYLAAFFSVGLCVTGIIAVENGIGRHIGTLSQQNMTMCFKVAWIGGIFYYLSIFLVKASLLVLYLRFAPNRTYRYLCYTLLALSTGHFVSGLMVTIFQCRPISSSWDRTIRGTCVNTQVFYLANGGFNILTDMLTYILPMPMLWGIQLPRRQKAGLCAVFSLGGLACVASIVRLFYLRELVNTLDASWAMAESFNWSIIELHSAIFATCIPTFKILLGRCFPSLVGSYGVSSSKSKGGRNHHPPHLPHHRGGHHVAYALGTMDTREHTTNHIEGGSGGGLRDRDRDRDGDDGGALAVGGDGESEILFIDVPDGGIVKTTEVEINVVERV